VVASLSVFRKFANQIFKNIPHLHIVDGARIKVKFRKCFNDREQPVVFVHLVDFFSEVQTALLGHQNFQHIRRKSLQITLEIGGNMVCVIYKLCEVKFTGVVELEAGNTVHRLCRKIRICFELLHDLLLGRCKSTLKATDDNILIFVAAVRSAQFICNGPDKIHFGRYIHRTVIPHDINNFFLRHIDFLRRCFLL